jgi:heat shock protein HslJ
MACSPALDSQEVEFLSLLEAVHYFDVSDDGALFLHTANGAIIKARRE